jgi:hypothetical protein
MGTHGKVSKTSPCSYPSIHLSIRFNKLQILVQNGLGDATVTPISGRILAANLNASIITVCVLASFPKTAHLATADCATRRKSG